MSGSVLRRFSLGQSRPRRIHMGHSQFHDASRQHAAWNAGKKVGTKRPFTQKQIWAIAFCSITRDAFGTVRCSIWQSTASFAAVTWSNQDSRCGRRTGDKDPRDRCSAKDGAAGSVRDHQRRESQPSALARTTWRLGRGLCIPGPGRSCAPHEHNSLRRDRGRTFLHYRSIADGKRQQRNARDVAV